MKENSEKYGSRVQLSRLKNGDIAFYVRFYAGRMRCKKAGLKSEGMTEAKAWALRTHLIEKHRHGSGAAQWDRARVTMDALWEEYSEHLAVHSPRSKRNYTYLYAKHVAPVMGRERMAKLGDTHLLALQKRAQDAKLADSTINMVTKLIRQIVNFGIKRGAIDRSPFKTMRMRRVNNGRLRWLTVEEIGRLIDAVKAKSDLMLFVRLSLDTAARAGSVLNVRVADLDLQRQAVALLDEKRHITYQGFLSDWLAAHLALVCRGLPPTHYVVSRSAKPLSYSSLYKRLGPVLDELFNAQLPKRDRVNRVVIHTLRHTTASQLALNGASIQQIQQILNHSDIKQTLKYAHLMPDSGGEIIKNLYKT